MSDRPQPKRTYSYESFIDELRPLITEGKSFLPNYASPTNSAFRRWVSELKSQLQLIKGLGYKPNENLGSRSFGQKATAQEHREFLFELDLTDTISELEILVRNFDIYGDQAVDANSAPVPSEADAHASIKKLRAVHASLENIARSANYLKTVVDPYLKHARSLVEALRHQSPAWFKDLYPLTIPSTGGDYYSSGQVTGFKDYVHHIIELWNSREEPMKSPATPSLPASPVAHHPQPATAPRRVFISHGRSKDWLEVQAYIEKQLTHLNIETLELAQEASGGLAIIEKLEKYASLCDAAVIVMSGDDSDANQVARVRENVMHEIGFFHGKYGRSKIILLHEDDVSVPTNLAGVVYQGYPRNRVNASFSELAKELRAIYQS